MPSFKIRIPCSSANLGPGFDVVGLALTLFLELDVTTGAASSGPAAPLNCTISYAGPPETTKDIPLAPDANLITQTALYVLRCHGQRAFPAGTHVHVDNPIPLGRGLGSSAAAVVAGAVLANEVGGLGLERARLLDYCLMIERHPDNVAAALFGGFVATYLNELAPEDLARVEIPLAEVLPAPQGGVDTGETPPDPPTGIGHCRKFPWAPEIKAVAVVPDFQVPTHDARMVLPETYSRQDVVFNLQRVALLPAALGQSPPDPETIYLAMQDRVHQPYRKGLIPGLPEILSSMSPATTPGLLGVSLSGAGPTILALATENFEGIANGITNKLKEEFAKMDPPREVDCKWLVLQPAEEGAIVERR